MAETAFGWTVILWRFPHALQQVGRGVKDTGQQAGLCKAGKAAVQFLEVPTDLFLLCSSTLRRRPRAHSLLQSRAGPLLACQERQRKKTTEGQHAVSNKPSPEVS